MVRRALAEPSRHVRVALSTGPSLDRLRRAVQMVVVRDARLAPHWILSADVGGAPTLIPAAESLTVTAATDPSVVSLAVAVRGASARDTIGFVEARFRESALISGGLGSAVGVGAVIAIVDRATGSMISPLPLDASLLRRPRFTWGGDEWVSSTRVLDDPNLEIIAAAPIAAFMVPFDRAARTGFLALALVATGGFMLVAILMRRMTHSLVDLATAADAVAGGDLDRRVDASSRDEVGRLAGAFNTMTESLRRTLRRALAAASHRGGGRVRGGTGARDPESIERDSAQPPARGGAPVRERCASGAGWECLRETSRGWRTLLPVRCVWRVRAR